MTLADKISAIFAPHCTAKGSENFDPATGLYFLRKDILAAIEEHEKAKQVKFEVREPAIFFHCSTGVFPVGGSGSLCYTTSDERAAWICDRLNQLAEEARKP